MIDIVKALFWIYAVIVIYIYFGYPLLLCVLSRLRPRRGAAGEDARPTVTFIIPAFNEEQNIAAKLENTIKLDYPIDRLEILVASNGSTDHTNDIVRSWPDQRVRLIALEQPGKLQALNEGACQASGEVLGCTDADFMLDRHSLLALVRPFVDAEVGGVCGCCRCGARVAVHGPL